MNELVYIPSENYKVLPLLEIFIGNLNWVISNIQQISLNIYFITDCPT
jgi:hypothetical protein